MSACAPAVSIPTATSVPPTITPTPTFTVTPTVTPTSTMTPVPTATPTEPPPANGVKVEEGIVYVKQGKVMLYDSKTGQSQPKELTDITFLDTFDASDIVKQLHPDYFEGDQQNFLDFMLPPKTYKDGYYDYFMTRPAWCMAKPIYALDIFGTAVDFAIIKAPAGFPGDKVYQMMLAIYGLDQPLPVMIGMQQNQKDDWYHLDAQEFSLYHDVNPIKPDSWVFFNSPSYNYALKNNPNDHNVLNDNIRGYFKNKRIDLILPFAWPLQNNSSNRDVRFLNDKSDFSDQKAIRYYGENYSAVNYKLREGIGFNTNKKPVGDVFRIMLEKYKSDPKLKIGFTGFVTYFVPRVRTDN